MARQSWIYDREAMELVTRDEYAKRQAQRKDCKRMEPVEVRQVERGSWVYDRERGELVTAAEYWSRKASERHGSGPMIISDYIGQGVQGLWHPATGKHVDSKREFSRMTRAAGCVEIGNESQPGPRAVPELSKADRVADIKKAFRQHGADVL